MKKTILLLSIILLFGFTIQTKNDPKLVGTWKGSEKNGQVEGVSKSWIMKRKSNGTYTIEFTIINEDNQKETIKEKGKWWTSGNQLFEQYEGNEKPAIYSYIVLNEKTIHFKMISSDVEFDDNNYEFIDTKIE